MRRWTRNNENQHPSFLGCFRLSNRGPSSRPQRPGGRCDFTAACLPGLKERFRSRWSTSPSSSRFSSSPAPVCISQPYDFHRNSHVSVSPVAPNGLAKERDMLLREPNVFDLSEGPRPESSPRRRRCTLRTQEDRGGFVGGRCSARRHAAWGRRWRSSAWTRRRTTRCRRRWR